MLNKYFKREEFACKCGCGFSTVDVELLQVLTTAREFFGNQLIIISPCRCDDHNEVVQLEADENYIPHSSTSKHMEGIAADIVVRGVDPSEVYAFLDRHEPLKYGVGKYNSFTHIDVRSKKARWNG